MLIQALLTLTFIVGLWCGIRLWRWLKARRLAISRLRGQEGERNAEQWLHDNGFTHIQSQTEQTFGYMVDGEVCTFKVRPDFFARFQGQKWLIEVKTGKSAAPEHQNTRRQIREYAQLWPNMKYGLFDGDHGTLKEVSFRKRIRIDQKSNVSSLIYPWQYNLIFTLGLCLGSYLTWYFVS